jgi:hypothetical protein
MSARAPHKLRWIRAAILLASVACSNAARGWGSHEHEEIGMEGYQQACAMLEREGTTRPSLPRREERMRLACGQVETAAHVYGQATSLGGDNFAAAKDFFTAAGFGKVWSRIHHALLARVNWSHFHPFASRDWRDHHKRALELAGEAARADGVDMVAGFERAFFESAFGDHFLQDGFAAGHMGFNRPASSAAAAYAFHNAWNQRGRTVHNRKGDTWITHGDNFLDDPRNVAGRAHVLHTETHSIFGVLATFVDGDRRPSEELEVIYTWPYTIEAPTNREALKKLVHHEAPPPPGLEPLAAVFLPARKDTIVDAKFFVSGSFAHGTPTLSGFEASFSLAIPFLPSETYLSVGVTGPTGERTGHALLGTGFRLPIFLTNEGILSHEIDVGIDWNVTTLDFFATVHGAYRLNLEVGRVLVVLMAGPSVVFPRGDIGYYGSVGLGWVFSAAGGGVPTH